MMIVKRFVGLLRAVNVGGAGRLPMADLVEMGVDAGFKDIRTYIASGNIIFTSDAPEDQVQSLLAERLQTYAGKPFAVFIRDALAMQRVLDANPFADRAGKHTVAFFLSERAPEDALERAKGVKGEEMRLGEREIYVHYPEGMGRSKLKIPAAETGTARNMNTIAKLAEMARQA